MNKSILFSISYNVSGLMTKETLPNVGDREPSHDGLCGS